MANFIKKTSTPKRAVEVKRPPLIGKIGKKKVIIRATNPLYGVCDYFGKFKNATSEEIAGEAEFMRDMRREDGVLT